MSALRVAVVGGGPSAEHEVSLASAAGVVTALRERGHDAVPLTLEADGSWSDPEGRLIGLPGVLQLMRTCDAVLPMVHGRGGEDGALPALIGFAGVPCVGTPLLGSAIGMDKWTTKLVAAALGIAVAPGRLVTRDAARRVEGSGPVVVKPVGAGSSRGVTLVERAGALPSALEAAFEHDDRVLVEDVVHGREVDVAVLGRPDGTRRVPPMLEILREGVFDFDAKYGGEPPFVVPAPLAAAEEQQLRGAALAIYDSLGCRGVARVDFFLTDDGPVFNEINTVPGFTPASQVPRMFAADGLGYAELVELLVTDALC